MIRDFPLFHFWQTFVRVFYFTPVLKKRKRNFSEKCKIGKNVRKNAFPAGGSFPWRRGKAGRAGEDPVRFFSGRRLKQDDRGLPDRLFPTCVRKYSTI